MPGPLHADQPAVAAMVADPPVCDRLGPFDVAGADVYVDTNDADFADELRWALGDLSVSQRPSADQVVFTTVRRDLPWVLWSTYRDGQARELTMNERYVLFHQQWELNQLMIERTPNALHAAGTVIDGGVVISCGSSMSGKTTLAGWLAVHGGAYFSDEVIGIMPGALARGFRRPLGIRHHGPLGSLLDDESRLTSRFHDFEMLVPPSSLGATISADEVVPVRALVFPTVDIQRPSEVTPIGQAETLALLGGGAPGLHSSGEAMFDVLVDLVQRVPAVRLSMNDMNEATDLLAAAIGWAR